MEKVAFISGSAKNLGRAIALDFAKQGFKVAVHYHTSRTDGLAVLKEVRKHTEAVMVSGDLTSPPIVKKIFKEISSGLSPVNILVNLIGNFTFQSINTTNFSKFKEVIESSLYSTFLCTQEVLPGMQKTGWGRIINFGCVAADSLTIRKNTTPYYIAKTGVIMLTKVQANAYAKSNITVNSISPGILKTSFVKTKTPVGRNADFPDIINAINFLIRDESNYINGANLEVAGGWRPGFE